MGKTLEMTIKKRMQNMVHLENKNNLFVVDLHFDMFEYFSFWGSPPDYQQGQTVRIMYVHVPAAWMALFIYAFIAIFSGVGLIWKNPIAHIAASAAAPVGACYTLICIVTGAEISQKKQMWK